MFADSLLNTDARLDEEVEDAEALAEEFDEDISELTRTVKRPGFEAILRPPNNTNK